MSTIKAFADENQSGELLAVYLTDFSSPDHVWAGMCKLLTAVVKRREAFGPMAGELTVHDPRAPDGYARWLLNLPDAVEKLCAAQQGSGILPHEGALGTRPLIWLPESVTHLELDDLGKPPGTLDTTVALQRLAPEVETGLPRCQDSALYPYRVPQVFTTSPGGSALSLYLYYDSEQQELALSAESWLDLWSETRFDGEANVAWADVNHRWLVDLFDEIAEETGAELEVVD